MKPDMTVKKYLCIMLCLCAALISSCTAERLSSPGTETAADTSSATEDLREQVYLPVYTNESVELSDDDVDLLTHLVACECGDLPYMTQVCFAALVLNRVEDPGFPHGVRGVVFDSGDFPSVISGTVTGTLPEGFVSTHKYRIAKKAVMEAAEGNDPTGGALYYSRSDADDGWVVPSYECGGMNFGF